MKEIIRHSGQQGVTDVVFGMAHRGRLNMLVNVLGKRPEDLFDEFAGKHTQAERFAGNKLSTMLFSTSVDPHWFKAGNCFWYEYKTGNGNVWYVVDPSAKTKRPLFDQDKLAAELTEIVKDPYTAQQLPIQKLETGEDGDRKSTRLNSSHNA